MDLQEIIDGIWKREVEFRVWGINEKRFLSESNVSMDMYGNLGWEFGYEPTIALVKKDYIRIEYTGFLDKNKKKIFVGYIVKNSSGEIGVVCYMQGRLGVQYENRFDDAFMYIVLEVIGNVFENPDLLPTTK